MTSISDPSSDHQRQHDAGPQPLPGDHLRPISWRLLIPLILVLLSLAAAAAILLLWQHKTITEREFRRREESVLSEYRLGYRVQAEMLSGQLRFIANDAGLIDALNRRDREQLIEDWLPLYEILKDEFNLVHFSILDANRTSVVRLHQPGLFGDVFNDRLMLRAEQEGNRVLGIEIGDMGIYTLQVIHPVRGQEGLLGYVILGCDLGDLMAVRRLQTESHLVSTVYKRFFDRLEWERGMRFLGHTHDWHLLPDHVISFTSWDPLPAPFLDLASDTSGAVEAGLTVPYDGQIWRVIGFPLYDSVFDVVGRMLVITDISETHANFRRLVWFGGSLYGLLILGLTLFVYILLGRADRRVMQQQSRLIQREEFQHAMLQSIGEAVIATDADGCITHINPIAVMLTGVPPEEAIGKPLEDIFCLVDAETRETLPNPVQESLLRQRTVGLPVDSLLISADEADSRVAGSCAPVRDREGHVFGAVLIFSDVTEEYLRQKTLQASEEKLSNILSSSREMIWSAKWPRGKLVFVSAAVNEIFGISQEEFLKEHELWHSRVHSDDANVYDDFVSSLIIGGTSEGEYRVIKPDESVIWLRDRCHLVYDEDGKPIRLDGITADITERKQAEEERVARERAEAANVAKSSFLANMSHEIRTPLNAIIGFSQILENDSTLSPQQAEQINTIARSGRHLLALINDILDISRIESGRLVLLDENFSLHDLIHDVDRMFRYRAESKGLQFQTEVAPDVPKQARGDEAKLRQVLINLVGNAVKFTKQGSITLQFATDSAPRPEGFEDDTFHLIVNVEDTGPGIPDHDLGLIFDSFQQSTAGRESGGTGLGLPISQRLVDMMGGSITVESEQGKGSRFRFDLWLQSATGDVGVGMSEYIGVTGIAPDCVPPRILIADDIDDNRNLLRDMLKQVGFKIKEVSNGQEAVEAFNAWLPNAVLMDIRMPVMNGYEATREIKKTEEGAAIPIIAVTASALEEDRQAVMDAGMQAFLRKPVRREELFMVLARLLNVKYTFKGKPAKAETSTSSHFAELDANAIAALPADLVANMRAALAKGQMSQFRDYVQQVATINTGIEQALQELARQYDYDRLNALFEAAGGTDR